MPRFFPLVDIEQHGSYQDGALVFNNPCELSLWDSRYIWPTSYSCDFALSLGTGTVPAPHKPSIARQVLSTPITRTCEAFCAQLDGQRAWDRLTNSLDDVTKPRFSRLNVRLENYTTVDDVGRMKKLKSQVHFQAEGIFFSSRTFALTIGLRIRLVAELLSKSFFFELDEIPRFEEGQFHCEGTIYCRNRSRSTLEALSRLCGNDLNFTMDDGFCFNSAATGRERRKVKG